MNLALTCGFIYSFSKYPLFCLSLFLECLKQRLVYSECSRNVSWQRGVSMWLKLREHRGCKVQRREKREGGVPGVYERMCEALAGIGETEAQGMRNHLESKPESLQ